MFNIETFSHTEFASVYRMWKYLESVLIPRIGALREVEL